MITSTLTTPFQGFFPSVLIRMANRGWKGTGLPGGASKRPEKPPPMVKNVPPTFISKFPRSPLKRPPTQTPDIVAKIPLTHNFSFGIFNPPKSEFLSIYQFIPRGYIKFRYQSSSIGAMLDRPGIACLLYVGMAVKDRTKFMNMLWGQTLTID
jgi:hypothetical protein